MVMPQTVVGLLVWEFDLSLLGDVLGDVGELRFLRIGKIHGDVHIWSEGMKGWEKLKTISTFSESIEESTKVRLSLKSEGAPTERRKAPRAPLVARSLMAAGGKVISGVCRDVSVGGMN
jgi:hypothetical protein